MNKFVVYGVAAVAVSVGSAAFAADCTWTGLGETAAWSDAGNWSKTPEAADKAIIPEGVTVRAVAGDRATLLAFGEIEIQEGATLFLDTITFNWDDSNVNNRTPFNVPLSGTGTFYANGARTCIEADNRNFRGVFAFTNAMCGVCSTYALGTTNDVWLKSTNTGVDGHTFKNWRTATGGAGTIGNVLHLAGGSDPGYVIYSMTNPTHFTNLVEVSGSNPSFYPGAGTAYAMYFDGGFRILGGSTLKLYGQSDNYNLAIFSGPLDLGTGSICARAGGAKISGKVTGTGTLDAARNTFGFIFEAANCCSADVGWWFDKTQAYTNGGYFDLGGFDQQCGDICIVPNTTPTFSGCVIKSTNPATLTCRGSAGRQNSGKPGTYAGLLKGAVSFCYDWDGRTGPKVGSQSNTGGIFTFTGEGSDTTGELGCRNGTMTVAATATFPNLTGLRAGNTGVIQVKTSAIGCENLDIDDRTKTFLVEITDTATMDFAENVCLTARTACVRGEWLRPGVYGSAETTDPNVPAANRLAGLTGAGSMAVVQYGGPKGAMILIR